jgi:hypothetical protein
LTGHCYIKRGWPLALGARPILMLESVAPLSDDPIVGLPIMAS